MHFKTLCTALLLAVAATAIAHADVDVYFNPTASQLTLGSATNPKGEARFITHHTNWDIAFWNKDASGTPLLIAPQGEVSNSTPYFNSSNFTYRLTHNTTTGYTFTIGTSGPGSPNPNVATIQWTANSTVSPSTNGTQSLLSAYNSIDLHISANDEQNTANTFTTAATLTNFQITSGPMSANYINTPTLTGSVTDAGRTLMGMIVATQNLALYNWVAEGTVDFNLVYLGSFRDPNERVKFDLVWYNRSVSEPIVIPEPQTYAVLMSIGVLAFVASRRLKFRKN